VTLADAYGAETADERRRQRVARAFLPDPQLEEAARLKREDRAAFAALPSTVKLQLGYYESAKAAAEAADAA
jgi:hypothetical protein